MIIKRYELRINEQEVGFKDIRLGELFIMIRPPTLWERLKNVTMLKLSENRIQELCDCNVRLTVKSALGPCYRASIYESD